MDTLHNGKSYFPLVQLLQQGHSFAQLMNQVAGTANLRKQVKLDGKMTETTLAKLVFWFHHESDERQCWHPEARKGR